jgi:hypothetical protein
MQLTYRGQTYTSTQSTATSTTTPAVKSFSYVLRYRGVVYHH